MSRTLKLASLVAVLAAAAAVTALPRLAAAGSATATLGVSATVVANCTITGGSISFVGYDPVGGADLDASGTISVACTKNAASYNVYLKPSGGTFTMVGPGNAPLSYALYSDSGRNTVWDGTNAYGYASAGKAAKSINVYGRIPGGQDVPVGSYAQNVTAEVDF